MWDLWLCYDQASCFAKMFTSSIEEEKRPKTFFSKNQVLKSFYFEKEFQYFLFAFEQSEGSYGIFFARKCQPKMLLTHHFERFLDKHHLMNCIVDHGSIWFFKSRQTFKKWIDTTILDGCSHPYPYISKMRRGPPRLYDGFNDVEWKFWAFSVSLEDSVNQIKRFFRQQCL